MLAAIIASIWLLAAVVEPLFEPILLAAALAMLTSPVLFEPLDRFIARVLPRLGEELRRRIAGVGATIGLGAALVAPVVVLVVASVGSIEGVFRIAVGVLTRDADALQEVKRLIDGEVAKLAAANQKLDLTDLHLGDSVVAFLGEATDMAGTFLSFIASGTGAVAQLALAIIALAFFYVEGPRLTRAILHYSPLRKDQQETLLQTHRATVLRLLNDTVANAVAKGVILGSIVWGVSNFLVESGATKSLPFVAVATAAGVITLLPLVGVTVVWLPLAIAWWTGGNYAAAIVVAVGCFGGNFYIDRIRSRLSRSIDESSTWRSFLLFLGLVGGLLSFGMKGLIIGPMAVVLVSTVCSSWLPLYGGGSNDEPTAPDLPDSTDAT